MNNKNNQIDEPPGPSPSDDESYEKQTSNNLSNVRDVLFPLWVRRSFQDFNGLDRFLLEYNFNFLPYFGLLLWAVLLFV
tara:strand:+ start:2432 stop:2668 length:237 start_codon:yes stop_codon:yes gene_type:complete